MDATQHPEESPITALYVATTIPSWQPSYKMLSVWVFCQRKYEACACILFQLVSLVCLHACAFEL